MKWTLKQRCVVVLGLSTATAALCGWLRTPAEEVASREPSRARTQTRTVSAAAPALSAHKAEFHADQKEKRIRRMLERLVATLPQKDLLDRSAYFSQQVESLADEDVPLMLARLDETLRQSEFGVLLLRRWTQSDPLAAGTWALALNTGEERTAALQHVATLWAGQDLAAANAWASALSDAPARQTVLLALAEETVRTQPVEALDLAGRLAPGHERDRVTVRAFSEWATQEPVSAMRWLARVDDPVLQHQMMVALIPVLANVDGNSGAQLTVAWLKPGPEQERIAVAVAQRWVQESPAGAAEWVNRFPPGAMRLAALDNLDRITKLMNAAAAGLPDPR
jgi:hypothetical protein